MDLFQKVVSLCKRRGFVFQTADIYGGVKSLYDFGHLGTLLKWNIVEYWKQEMLFNQRDILFLDGSVILPYSVVKASGHIDCFTDPMVDCKKCKSRFRPDKALQQFGEVKCPACGSQELSDVRFFNLMFRTNLGPVDYAEEIVDIVTQNSNLDSATLKNMVLEKLTKESVYLRPETAQNIFTQFLNYSKTYPRSLPFGIAQIGRAFRNEIVTEKFLFRVAEFEQMEVEYFIKPEDAEFHYKRWIEERKRWWQNMLTDTGRIRAREYSADELAHYAKACTDIEFRFPWGFDEVEGIASRTNYDLAAHQSGSNKEHFVVENTVVDGKQVTKKVQPWVIEPSCGLTRAVLAVLLDAYFEDTGKTAEGEEKTRVVLRLKPFLAPIKAAVFPLVKDEKLVELAQKIFKELLKARIVAQLEVNQSIGKRYAKHDEIGTPFCLTVDFDSLRDESVTIRDRDSTSQHRVHWSEAVEFVKESVAYPDPVV